MPEIVITDKNPLILSALQSMIEEDGRFGTVVTCSNGNALLEALDKASFDVAIIGWDLKDMGGEALLVYAQEQKIETRFIIYSDRKTHDILRKTIELGAWGFNCKTETPELLLDTLFSVSQGRMSFPYMNIVRLLEDPLAQLTERERELLAALADGWTNLQIAARFGISQNTVKFHLKNLYEKLNVKNRAMAVGIYVSQYPRRERY